MAVNSLMQRVTRVSTPCLRQAGFAVPVKSLSVSAIQQSESSKHPEKPDNASNYGKTPTSSTKTPSPGRKKTMAELDAELREKLEGLSGDGGGAGVEYENGRAEGLKRNVKANMFRLI